MKTPQDVALRDDTDQRIAVLTRMLAWARDEALEISEDEVARHLEQAARGLATRMGPLN